MGESSCQHERLIFSPAAYQPTRSRGAKKPRINVLLESIATVELLKRNIAQPSRSAPSTSCRDGHTNGIVRYTILAPAAFARKDRLPCIANIFQPSAGECTRKKMLAVPSS